MRETSETDHAAASFAAVVHLIVMEVKVMARLSGKKIILCFLAVVAASLAFCASPSAAEEEEDPLLGVREGWSWPVVVTPPPDGWESGAGRSIKYAMRAAEREISLRREGIKGREVTFMFSDISETSELPSRLATWRAMKVSVIASFSGAEFNEELAKMCRDDGPSLLLSGGEDTAIRSPDSGRPYPYIFALDLPYYSRANALAEAALLEQPGR
ncbi:MAG: hypothetical protein LBQ36_07475, partial [Synergistaceae bacterium]|nr:hypothetical protein [Synergistaceae bacterium]